jgi:hypothetical protein
MTVERGVPFPTELQPCAVCSLVDGDTAPKQCVYCSMCSSWICLTCRPNLPRRAKAMMLKQLTKSAGGDA